MSVDKTTKVRKTEKIDGGLFGISQSKSSLKSKPTSSWLDYKVEDKPLSKLEEKIEQMSESQPKSIDPKPELTEEQRRKLIEKMNTTVANIKILPLQSCNISGDPCIIEPSHCKLDPAQARKNYAAFAIIATFYTVTSVLSLGVAGPAILATISGAASMLPIPPKLGMPTAPKNTYYLGYSHDRAECIQKEGQKDVNLRGINSDLSNLRSYALLKKILPEKIKIGYVVRGRAKDSNNGCFVWTILSYQNTTNARIIVFGGSDVRKTTDGKPAIFEGSGAIMCSLELEPSGRLVFVIKGNRGTVKDMAGIQSEGFNEDTFRVPVHWQDQIQYISCGIRPTQFKWHVTVEDAKIKNIALKNPLADDKLTGEIISTPQRDAIALKAMRCNVWPDGTYGKGLAPQKEGFYKRWFKNFDLDKVMNPRYLLSKTVRWEQALDATPILPKLKKK
jgi:hypothetical protein